MTRQPLLRTLTTDRLLLRPSRPADASVYRQMWTERDHRVPAHRRIDVVGRPTVADIAADIHAEAARPDEVCRLLALERQHTGDVIGYCGLVTGGVTFPDGSSPVEPELAFELLQAAHGHGFATEAGQAVVAWAAGSGCERLWATVRHWNAASLRVLEKLGFRDTGEREPDDGHGASLITVCTL